MIGDGNHHHGMMVQVPPWTTLIDDNNPAAGISPFSPRSPNAIASSIEDYAYFLRSDAALRRYLEEDLDDGAGSGGCTDFDITSEAYACDAFRMYEFKVRKCARGRSHDWTDCPYAHPGEKARRRDPRKYSYSGTACPEFRKGSCKKGDGCEFAHGVFECWLHPHRYRTQPCKDGGDCRRRVCFFAHAPEQLRVVSPHGGAAAAEPSSYDGSASSASAPDSPTMDGQALSRSLGSVTVSDMLTSLRRLQLNSKAPNMGATWNVQMGRSLASPRSGFYSLPSTPTRPVTRAVGYSGIWEDLEEEEPAMERVESGRDLRARMFEKLSKENGVDGPGEGPNPDVGWISELVK